MSVRPIWIYVGELTAIAIIVVLSNLLISRSREVTELKAVNHILDTQLGKIDSELTTLSVQYKSLSDSNTKLETRLTRCNLQLDEYNSFYLAVTNQVDQLHRKIVIQDSTISLLQSNLLSSEQLNIELKSQLNLITAKSLKASPGLSVQTNSPAVPHSPWWKRIFRK